MVGAGGVVTGPLLDYFRRAGYVQNVGWPAGNAMTDRHGTWQRFTSNGNTVRGAIMQGKGGTWTVKGAVYDRYVSTNSPLRDVVGSPRVSTGASSTLWAAGVAHPFDLGYVMAAKSGARGVLPNSFTPDVQAAGTSKFSWNRLAALGWPTGLPYGRCGGWALNFEKAPGYAMSDGRWCPAANFAQSTTAIARPAMPSSLTSAGGGDAGLNVKLVQRALKVPGASARYGPLERITGTTATAIATKRSQLGLGYAARIDEALWSRLGISVPWAYGTTPESVSLPLSATRKQRVDAFLRYVQGKTLANGYEYTYGAYGPQRAGFDCSGLVLAGLHHAGVQPKSANILADIVHPTKLTQALYNDTSFKKVPISQRQPGDLILFTSNGSASGIGHVGIYLGGDRMFDTENNGYEGYTRSIYWATTPRGGNLAIMATAVRPIAEG